MALADRILVAITAEIDKAVFSLVQIIESCHKSSACIIRKLYSEVRRIYTRDWASYLYMNEPFILKIENNAGLTN